MYRDEFWQKWSRPRELYPDASSKDAPVPPDLIVPNCDCGFPVDASSKALNVFNGAFEGIALQ